MIKPTLHLNGTSAKDLAESIGDAILKIVAAQSALRQTWPNARDYYPQGLQAWPQAMKEHESRLKRLEGILSELEELQTHIHESL